jgi:hypothetical protein
MDVPLKGRLATSKDTLAELGRNEPLWVCCRKPFTKEFSQWVEFTNYSPMARQLGSIETYSARKIRVFFARSLNDRLSDSDMSQIESHIRDWLDRHTQSWTPTPSAEFQPPSSPPDSPSSTLRIP